MTSKMKLNQIVTALLFFCSLLTVQAQVTYSLLSGQKIVILQDGTWEKAVQIIEEDTTGMLMIEVDPMSDPAQPEFVLDDKHAQAIDTLKKEAEKNEIQYFLLKSELEKRKSASELSLRQAKQMKNVEGEKSIKKEIKDTQNRIKAADKSYKNAAKQIAVINDLKFLDNIIRDKEIEALGAELSIDVSSYIINQPEEEAKEVSTIEEVLKNNTNCKVSKDDSDGKVRTVEMEFQPFYAYTPEKLKNHFKTKDLLVSDAKIIRKGKNLSLALRTTILSKDAAKNYGIIDNQSMMRVFFVSGKSVTIYSKESSLGRIENYTGNIVYEAEYALDGEALDALERSPIDNIGIMWSSGYESYVVYNVDAIMSQLACLKKL